MSSLSDQIREELQNLYNRMKRLSDDDHSSAESRRNTLASAADAAHELREELKRNGRTISVSPTVRRNRYSSGYKNEDDRDFYENFHAIEDILKDSI